MATAGDQVRVRRRPAPRRPTCGCPRRARCGGASRRGSFTAPTSTRAAPARSSAVRNAPTRWSGWSAARRSRPATALMSLPGVGEWTAAETAQRAFGDADALSVGDYHLAKMVGWRLLGQPIDDPAMVELLEPLRPHRHRAVRLLEVTGTGCIPRAGLRVRRSRTCARSSRGYRLCRLGTRAG